MELRCVCVGFLGAYLGAVHGDVLAECRRHRPFSVAFAKGSRGSPGGGRCLRQLTSALLDLALELVVVGQLHEVGRRDVGVLDLQAVEDLTELLLCVVNRRPHGVYLREACRLEEDVQVFVEVKALPFHEGLRRQLHEGP